MKVQQRGRFEDDRGTDKPAWAHEDRTQAGDHAISGTEIGRPFSRTIEDQQLVLDEDGFGHYGTRAAGTGEPGDGRQQMQKQDGQIAHRAILLRSRDGQRMLANFGIRHAQVGSARYGAARDTNGRPSEVRGPAGDRMSFQYGADGALALLAVRVGSREGTWTFDRGRLQAASDLSGGRSSYGNDAAGRLASVVDAYGGKTQYAYNALGRLTRVTLADGVETVYTYDDKRRSVEVKRGGSRRLAASDSGAAEASATTPTPSPSGNVPLTGLPGESQEPTAESRSLVGPAVMATPSRSTLAPR